MAAHEAVLDEEGDRLGDVLRLPHPADRGLAGIFGEDRAPLLGRQKSHHGVSMTPGDTPFTRSGLSSAARIGTREATAAFAALIPAVPGIAA